MALASVRGSISGPLYVEEWFVHVTAVVVAYNRRDLLAEALRALALQTRLVDSIVVVDNASSDGSAAVARGVAPAADIVSLARNTGGAGGFAIGIERAATRHSADLVWIMDDDTIPSPKALSHLLAARAQHAGTPAVVASKVIWTDGTEHPMNTPRRKPLARRREAQAALAVGCIPVRSASFVSLLVDIDSVRKHGLPLAAYFIWNDDFEFTGRLLRRGIGLFCPQSVVLHKTRVLGSTDVDPGPRFFYEVRNKLWLFRRSTALSATEKTVYIGASVVRWSRTFIRSSDRATLRTAFRSGWRDGWRSNPEPNATALSDLGEVGAAVAKFEAAVAAGRTR